MATTDKSSHKQGRVPYEISWWQMASLLICVHLSVVVSYTPTISGSQPPVRDSWLAALMAWIPGFLLALVAWWLAKRFEGQNLFELTKTIFGRVLGTLVNVAFILYLLHWTTIVTREFAVFTASVVYLQTPELVFSIVFIMVAIVGAGRQIEFVARVAEFAAPVVVGSLLLLLLASVRDIDFGMLRPVLAEGWEAVGRQALPSAAFFAEAAWVTLLAMPYLNNFNDGPKALATGFGVNVTFSAMMAAVLIGIFGTELLTLLSFPAFAAARLIRLGTFLERLEWPLLVLWIGAMGVRVSLVMLGARLGISSLFPNLRTGYVLALIGAAVFAWSLYVAPTVGNVLDLFSLGSLAWPQLPAQAVPIVLAVGALLRGAGANRS